MINKTITFAIVGLFLISLISAQSVQLGERIQDKNNQLDFKAKDLVIKEDGIYEAKTKLRTKEQAEVWIDKKVQLSDKSVRYHIDSLIQEPTKVKVQLFYEVQPDTIEYVSHTGAYKEIFTYNDWEWEDKTDCGEEEYCGGYATIETTLEYGVGSNTFTSAISGATWMNDGVTITLTEDTDYTLNEDEFTISNINYAWNGITVNYDYLNDTRAISSTNEIISDFVSSGKNTTSSIPTVGTMLGISLLLTILIGILVFFLSRFGNIGNSSIATKSTFG